MRRKNRWSTLLITAIAAMLLLPGVISAGGYLLVSKSGVIYKWDSANPIPQHIDGGNFGLLIGAAAANFAEDAILIWSDEPTLALSFTFETGTLVPDGDVSTLAEFLTVAAAGNGKSPVVFDDDGSILTGLGVPPGVIGLTLIKNRDDNNFRITESLQLYNGMVIDGNLANGEISLDEMAIAITHEMGHALNFDHTQVNGHYFVGDTDDPGFAIYGPPPAGVGVVNIMFPFAIGSGNVSDTPNRDDLATAEFLYGNGTGATGKISGYVFESDGSSHLQGANIIARNIADPFFDAVSSVSGYLYWPSGPGSGFAPANLKGKYDLNGLTSGANYTVEKVRVHPTFRFGSSVGPLDVPVYFDVEEFYNGNEEAADAAIDLPLAFVHVSASASDINFIANVIAGKIELGDDDVAEISLPFAFPLCGNTYNSVFVHSNGFLTFGAASDELFYGAFESVTDFLTDPPRIAPLWDDLNPSSTGLVTALPSGVDFVIRFQDVPEYVPAFGAGGANSFSVKLRADGSFRIEYGGISATDGLVGRSNGQFATDPGAIDLSVASQPIKSTNPSDAIYEIFNLLTGTPNDLSGLSLEFAPCSLTPAPPIEPAVLGVCYASTGAGGENAGSLLSFNPVTGAASKIGPSGYSGISGLAINSSGEMYGVTTDGGSTYLLRISATTGYAETVALITTGAQPAGAFEAIAFNKNDLLFGINRQNELYTIDPASGIATKVGATGIDPNAVGILAGMTFEPNSGQLFASLGQNGSGSGLDEIYEINPATGEATLVGKTGLGSGTDDLIFIDGSLYGSSTLAGQSSLIKIDTATGTGAVIGAFGFDAVHGLACFGAQTPTVLEYVLLAKEDIKISGNRISEGKIHSNQAIHFDAGEPGTHTGNISAVGKITIEKNNTIIGDVTAGDKLYLFGDATVTGAKSENASINPITVQEPSFSANNADQTAPKKGKLVLPPDTYGKVKALKNSELHFSTGNYYLKELDTDRKSRLIIDVAAGPVNIYVIDDLDFDDGVEVEILPSGQNGTRFVTFTTLQTHKVDFGKSSLVLGSILAPKAKVQLTKGSVFKGAIYAQSINVQNEVPFLHHDAVTPLPKPAPLPDEEINSVQYLVDGFELQQNYPNPFNPSTVISFQLPVNSHVDLVIYSATGQVVTKLVSEGMPSGVHRVVWDGTDEIGVRVASGVYVYRMRAGGYEFSRKLLLVR